MLIGLRSHAHVAPFRLHRPGSVAEALAMRAQTGGAFMAGGIELIGRMKWGEEFCDVIHLARVAGLADITEEGETLRIGAGATHAAIAGSEAVARLLPDLAALWPEVANPRIRFTGTLGGNIAAGQPGYDGMPALLALGAELESKGDLITAARIPAGTWLFAERSLKPAIIAWLGISMTADRVASARIGFGGAHDRAISLELPLAGRKPGEDAAEAAAFVTLNLPEPRTDTLASAAYRRRMAGVLTRRLLTRAGARA